ncbi:hypothetical protein HK096_010497 [Nowakowskiella sp. JEL0078]|nr:hypothetical protein HK096_010497 [Nowakowskiella sp. JEL0078]
MLLSARVTASESAFFSDVCEVLHLDDKDGIIFFVQTIEQIAKRRFGPETRARIQGSMYKKTEINRSDVDVLVDTDQSTTEEDRLKFAEDLKKHPLFNSEHVALGKLAIHVKTFLDIDVVFRYQVEHGEQKPASDELRFKQAAQNAIRILKYFASQGLRGKIPGMYLEKITLDVERRNNRLEMEEVGDGAMQLFIDILQALKEDYKKALNFAKEKALRVLHVFVVSRVCSPSGFRNPQEIQSWLHEISDGYYPSVAGPIPMWVADSRILPPVGISEQFEDLVQNLPKYRNINNSTSKKNVTKVDISRIYRKVMNIQDVPSQDEEIDVDFLNTSLPPTAALKTLSTDHFLSKYLLNEPSSKTTSESCSFKMLSHLYELYIAGSVVAGHMLHARSLWLQGESEIDSGKFFHGVELLAASLRLSLRDGDSFSGSWQSSDRYVNATSTVLKKYPRSTDVHLVLGFYYLNIQMWNKAEMEATIGIEIDDKDAYGCIALRGIIRGNLEKSNESLQDWKLANSLEPEEPIFYYWCGVASRNLLKHGSNPKKTIEYYTKFVNSAPPEGRKVSESFYSLVFLEAMYLLNDISNQEVMKRICDLYRRGLEMEAQILDVFLPYESVWKDQAERTYKIFLSKLTNVPIDPVNVFNLREKCKADFERGNYGSAHRGYTSILSLQPNDYKILSNRSLVRCRLDMFERALEDARDVVRLQPDWMKGHYRVAFALWSLGRYTEAISAAEVGLMNHSGESELIKIREKASDDLRKVNEKVPFDVKSMKIWEQVLYKNAVLLVSSPEELRKTLFMCCKPPPDGEGGWTIIIRMNDNKYDFRRCFKQGIRRCFFK